MTASSSKTVVALNGFLGRPSDWDHVPDLLLPDWKLLALDPTKISGDPNSGLLSFDQWARQCADFLKKTLSPDSTNVLLGYSLGGRLALHLLLEAPELFRGAVIVSANPGLLTDDERAARVKADEKWAEKFEREPWPHLLQDWNSQSTLRAPQKTATDAVQLERRESDFERRHLTGALKTWSLGVQRNLRPELAEISIPIEFITGEGDAKFTAIARDLVSTVAKVPRTHVIIEEAGHRVPWDAPSTFRKALALFLEKLA